MNIRLIWAQSLDGVIGVDGGLPWRLPEDLRHFRSLTMGSTVVMGRRTWESLPPKSRPLSGRRNVVLSRGVSSGVSGAEFVRSPEEVIELCCGDAWVIGGATVYQQFLPFATTAEVTEVAGSFAGDAYAPALDESWRLASDSDTAWRVSETGLSFRFCRYLKEPSLIDLAPLQGLDARPASGVTKFGHSGV